MFEYYREIVCLFFQDEFQIFCVRLDLFSKNVSHFKKCSYWDLIKDIILDHIYGTLVIRYKNVSINPVISQLLFDDLQRILCFQSTVKFASRQTHTDKQGFYLQHICYATLILFFRSKQNLLLASLQLFFDFTEIVIIFLQPFLVLS